MTPTPSPTTADLLRAAPKQICPKCRGYAVAWADFGPRDRVLEICDCCWGCGVVTLPAAAETLTPNAEEPARG